MKKLIKVLAVGMLLATALIGCEKQEMYVEPTCECRFAEVTNRNVYAIKDFGGYQDREMFYIKESEAEILGL
jgi:hypothetical protein